MSKKKNTLRDLDNFLKQQASLLVVPESPAVAPVDQSEEPDAIEAQEPEQPAAPVTSEAIESREKLYDLIIHSLEKRKDPSPEDAVLINTALYLKSGSNWREAIRQYWQGR